MYLVTGSNGQLGSELKRLLGDKADYTDRNLLDITNPEAVRLVVNPERYQAVINCAAYTAVDKAEDDAETAARINIEGRPTWRSAACRLFIFRPITCLTAKTMFPISKPIPHGRSRFTAVPSLKGKNRDVAGGYGRYHPHFLALFRIRQQLCQDHATSGQGTRHAEGDFRPGRHPDLCRRPGGGDRAYSAADQAGNEKHLSFSNEGVCSWYDFARAIIEMSGLSCDIRPIESWEYPSKAARPPYSVLNKAKIKKDFGIRIRHWRDALRECIDNLEENNL